MTIDPPFLVPAKASDTTATCRLVSESTQAARPYRREARRRKFTRVSARLLAGETDF